MLVQDIYKNREYFGWFVREIKFTIGKRITNNIWNYSAQNF